MSLVTSHSWGSGETPFLIGLSAFAVGHLAYAGGALSIGTDVAWMLPGVIFMVALVAYRFLTRTVAGARRHGGAVLAGAVLFYATVIAVMVVTAWGTASLLAGVGATMFAVSDWVLGHRRFAGPLPGGRFASDDAVPRGADAAPRGARRPPDGDFHGCRVSGCSGTGRW